MRKTEEAFRGSVGLNRWDRVRRMLLAAIDVVAAPDCAARARQNPVRRVLSPVESPQLASFEADSRKQHEPRCHRSQEDFNLTSTLWVILRRSA